MSRGTSTAAVQIFGGYGHARDYAAERLTREAELGEIIEWTSQIHGMIIARHLVGRGLVKTRA